MLVLLAILLSLSIACSEEMLRVSIIPEVEAYIDELSLAQGRKCSTDALQNCIRELESMGGKTASAMRLYCTVLVALDDGDFDTAKSAMSLLVLPNVAASFDESIVGSAAKRPLPRWRCCRTIWMGGLRKARATMRRRLRPISSARANLTHSTGFLPSKCGDSTRRLT